MYPLIKTQDEMFSELASFIKNVMMELNHNPMDVIYSLSKVSDEAGISGMFYAMRYYQYNGASMNHLLADLIHDINGLNKGGPFFVPRTSNYTVHDLLEPGTQIVYIPNHLKHLNYTHKENYKYPNGLQPGFVAAPSKADDAVFCRYWQCYDGFDSVYPALRTTGNSELTYIRDIALFDSVGERKVMDVMEGLGLR